jgi:hypothetical protein
MSDFSAPVAMAPDELRRRSATATETDVMAMTVIEVAAADEIGVARKTPCSLCRAGAGMNFAV